jgi:hypothetical protein
MTVSWSESKRKDALGVESLEQASVLVTYHPMKYRIYWAFHPFRCPLRRCATHLVLGSWVAKW